MSDRPEYHALYYHLGPFGRQDIHLHPRFDCKSEADVLVGFGRTCDRRPGDLHVQKRLSVGAAWSKRGQEGQPLSGPVGREPRPAEVVTLGESRPTATTTASTRDGDASGRTDA